VPIVLLVTDLEGRLRTITQELLGKARRIRSGDLKARDSAEGPAERRAVPGPAKLFSGPGMRVNDGKCYKNKLKTSYDEIRAITAAHTT